MGRWAAFGRILFAVGANMSSVSIALLRSILRYDPETGRLFWLPRHREMFATENAFRTWNARYGNSEAFTATNGNGYRRGGIGNRLYFAHRVAWAIHTGEWPAAHIDHINGDGLDNRIENLRAVSNAENMQNMTRATPPASGFLGVTANASGRSWQARIRTPGGTHRLGSFPSPEEAHAAYLAAKTKLHTTNPTPRRRH